MNVTHLYRGGLHALVKYLLENRLSLPREHWTVQGFGFMRLRIAPNYRLHLWHSALRIPGVSDIHDHAQWAFSSRIFCGQLVNIRFVESAGAGARYNRGVIKCGMGGGMTTEPPVAVDLTPQRAECYEATEQYEQQPDEIHRTYAADGTITLIRQDRRETDTARVYWPLGTQWVDAIPRPATLDEINDIGAHALAIFGA